MFRANIDTGWLQTNINAVRTIVALGSRLRLWINVKGVVRTGLHARLTTNAAVLIKIDDTIGTCKQRRRGAYIYARGVSAMVASHDGEQAARIWKLALFNLFDPSAIHSNRHVVL